MTKALSLIANPSSHAIEQPLIDGLRERYPHCTLRQLSKGVACDIEPIQPDSDISVDVQKARQGRPIDVNLIDIDRRRKRLLIADMDSTIIQQECIDELAEFAGKRAEISAITERAMRGELDFEAALKERVAMLKGLPETVLQETFDNRITLTPGAKTLVRKMNDAGAVTALVSGGFTFFTSRVAAACGFEIHQANELIVEDGVLTGQVRAPILGQAAKQEALMRIAAENGVALAETLAVGDGANDLAMLEKSGLGVAFHAKPAVAEAADARIDYGDLTALLYLQGYADSEFTSAE
jgi:phosphoserine phosphatase